MPQRFGIDTSVLLPSQAKSAIHATAGGQTPRLEECQFHLQCAAALAPGIRVCGDQLPGAPVATRGALVNAGAKFARWPLLPALLACPPTRNPLPRLPPFASKPAIHRVRGSRKRPAIHGVPSSPWLCRIIRRPDVRRPPRQPVYRPYVCEVVLRRGDHSALRTPAEGWQRAYQQRVLQYVQRSTSELHDISKY